LGRIESVFAEPAPERQAWAWHACQWSPCRPEVSISLE